MRVDTVQLSRIWRESWPLGWKDVSAICSKALVLHPLTAFTDCISERILVGITTYPSRNAGKEEFC